MDSRTLALIPRAMAINLVVGQVVAIVKLPVYLDSIGTVLVGVLCGPLAGALTGFLSNVLVGFIAAPTMLPFAVVGAVIGALAGGLASARIFRAWWSAVCGGACVGVVAAACSAPISAWLFGGVTGGGTDLVVALFRAQGLSALQASFSQGLTVDPLDKAITFAVVAWVLRCASARLLDQYPRGAVASGRAARAWRSDEGLAA